MSLHWAERRVLRTGSRLHFTLIDMNGESGRIDGGVGVALQHPSIEIRFRPHNRLRIRCEDWLEPFLAKELVTGSRILAVAPKVEVEVRSAIPRHRGLGSGTQWRLALLAILNAVHHLGFHSEQLVARSGRAGASGIGAHAFLRGGLLVDGGHRLGVEKEGFDPSRFNPSGTVPPLLARHRFPAEWAIVLYVPSDLEGLEGLRERQFMRMHTPVPRPEVEAVSHVILMRLLPALVQRDLEAFGAAVDVLQRVGWKRRHWARPQLHSLRGARRALQDEGVVGAGLSSTGPTLFGFFDRRAVEEERIRHGLAARLAEAGAPPGTVWITEARNGGMELEDVQTPSRGRCINA